MKALIIKHINTYFNYVKIATLDQVKNKLKTMVSKTVRRYLKELEYFSSYSHNGKHYSHKRFAIFDTNGLWTFRGIHFSTYGNLIDTIENFVSNSESGYNSSELQKRLQVKVSDTLLELIKNKKITRKKIDSKFYYFSNISAIQKAQLLLCRSKVEINFGTQMNKEKMHSGKIKQGSALFFIQLDEKQQRLYSGLESALLGYGGDKIIAKTLGLDPHTVSRGRREILSGDFEKKNIRRKGGGRKLIKKKVQK